MTRPRRMFLGAAMPPGGGKVVHHHVPPHHLVTHGVVLGMTGSGKTGLLMVTVEEALRALPHTSPAAGYTGLHAGSEWRQWRYCCCSAPGPRPCRW